MQWIFQRLHLRTKSFKILQIFRISYKKENRMNISLVPQFFTLWNVAGSTYTWTVLAACLNITLSLVGCKLVWLQYELYYIAWSICVILSLATDTSVWVISNLFYYYLGNYSLVGSSVSFLLSVLPTFTTRPGLVNLRSVLSYHLNPCA